jgi:hypothetical protein
MALPGSQQGVPADRRHTRPSDQGPAGMPGWLQAEQFEQGAGVSPMSHRRFRNADGSCPHWTLGF